MSGERGHLNNTSILRFESRFFTEHRFLVYGSTAASSYTIGLAWRLIQHKWLIADGAPCTDFIWIWLSSKLALTGALAQAYNYAVFSAVHRAMVGAPDCILEHFDYPPTLLVYTYPLGLAPFSTAFVLWVGVTLLLYLAAVYVIVPRPAAVIAALTAYPVIVNVLAGHNGFLTAGLMGLSLAFMPRRPWLSGIFLGLLTYKPQLGILFPIALFASRKWRVLLSAIAATTIFALIATVAFGYRAWPLFADALVDRASSLSQTPHTAFALALVSVFGFLRSLGVNSHISWAVQLLVTGVVAVMVSILWARPIPYSLKAAALCIGSLLAAPHAHDYDACILSIAGAFLVKDGLLRGFLPGERTVMLMCWAGLIFWVGPFPAIICAVLLVLVVRRVVLCQEDVFAAPRPLQPQGPEP